MYIFFIIGGGVPFEEWSFFLQMSIFPCLKTICTVRLQLSYFDPTCTCTHLPIYSPK